MTTQITLTHMTWEEIEHAAANGGRCLVMWGCETETEEATVIKFEFDLTAMTKKVLVRFDDDVEIDYFVRDIYRIEEGA